MCGVRVQSFYPWPTCETHYNLNQDHSDFYSWVWKSMYDPHGPVHLWLGGLMDCHVRKQDPTVLSVLCCFSFHPVCSASE